MPFRLQSVLKIAGVRTTGKSHSFYLMRLHEHRGMPAEAVAQLEKAAALFPSSIPRLCWCTRVPSQGQKEKALKILSQLETQAKKKAAFPVISLP